MLIRYSEKDETGINPDADLPQEMVYADDYDNITTELEKRYIFKTQVKEILERDNLLVNETKTEETTIRRNKHEKKDKNEPWRDCIKLGSKLGDKEDIERRKQLARVKLIEMKKILKRKHVVRLEKKMKLYNALTKSVLTYNSCTWGLTMVDERNLNSFHRKQLRQVCGVYYPNTIGNEELYKLTKTRPLSIDITKARWKMFGHVLRMKENTPARKSHEMVLLGSNGRRDSKVQRKEEGDNRDNIKQRHRTYTTTQHKLYTTKTYIRVASAKH